MRKNTDRLLKILIVIATLIILGTLATLAFLNFSAEESRNDRSQTTTARVVTSSTNSTSTSTTEESEESSSTSSRSTSKATTATTSKTRVAEQPSEPVKTQAKLTLEEAIKENANEARGERVTTSGSKSFDTQAEAHEYGLAEINRIAKEEGNAASYVVKAVRDSAGKVVSWEADITVN